MCWRISSVEGLAPERWAARAVALYRKHQADCLVAEVNFGGDLVRSVLQQIDRNLPLRQVRATRGKYVRAEPVALLYAQGKVKHVGAGLAALEDELCDIVRMVLSLCFFCLCALQFFNVLQFCSPGVPFRA